MATLVNLRDLLQHEIEDLYSAEEQIIEALPKMVEKASDRELKAALNEHLKVTREQKKRLDKVRQILKKGNNENKEQKGFLERLFGIGTKCKGTEGLIKEGEKMMEEDMDAKVKDAAIIASAQKIEHYEISGYGTAKAYAGQLGLGEIVMLLETTLNEEYRADDALTTLAMGKVNVEAENGKGNDLKKKENRTREGLGSNRAKDGKTNTAAAGRELKKPTPKKATHKKTSVKKEVAKKRQKRR